jgi:hypothetical protein
MKALWELPSIRCPESEITDYDKFYASNLASLSVQQDELNKHDIGLEVFQIQLEKFARKLIEVTGDDSCLNECRQSVTSQRQRIAVLLEKIRETKSIMRVSAANHDFHNAFLDFIAPKLTLKQRILKWIGR